MNIMTATFLYLFSPSLLLSMTQISWHYFLSFILLLYLWHRQYCLQSLCIYFVSVIIFNVIYDTDKNCLQSPGTYLCLHHNPLDGWEKKVFFFVFNFSYFYMIIMDTSKCSMNIDFQHSYYLIWGEHSQIFSKMRNHISRTIVLEWNN